MIINENERLTRVGPGTPGGALLRMYWHPIAMAQDLSPGSPTKSVRLLGEDLVLFRDKSGNVGLLADHCSHRSASLCYGRVEERGIACAYHGWLYDTKGNILETPPERNQAIMNSVKQPAYPVKKFIGMYWAYLGPLPAPEIPRYDVWARRDGHRTITVHPRLDCNWLQAMENSVDPAHLQILHQEFIAGNRPIHSTTRGFTDDVESYTFYVADWGAIMKRRVYKTGYVEEHPLIFPNILRQGINTQIRVPIDDTHTAHIFVGFQPTRDGSIPDDEPEDPPVEYLDPYKDNPGAIHPEAHYTMHTVLAQDHAMWETQGAVTDRTKEHLSYSDRGVVLLRRVLLENIDRVERGEDPIGVVRDPQHAIIATNLEAAGRETEASRGEMASAR